MDNSEKEYSDNYHLMSETHKEMVEVSWEIIRIRLKQEESFEMMDE